MRKVKPTIQVFLICLACLFTFNAIGQKMTNNTAIKSEKGNKTFTTTDLNTSSSTFIPKNQAATDAQMQQVQISVNNQQPAAAVSGSSTTKINYDFPSVPASENLLNEVKGIGGQDAVTAPPNNNLTKSAVCSGVVDYSDVNVCSTNLPIGVGIVDGSCNFTPESLDADGILTFSGVEIYPVSGGVPSPFPALTTFESETLGSTVCTSPAFQVPPNTTCEVIEYDFIAITYIYTGTIIDGGVEIISKTLDVECENTANISNAMDGFTIFVYPVLSLEIVDDSPVNACGVVEAQLETASGEACTGTVSAPCSTNGEILSFAFDYPFEGIGCPETQFMTVTSPCSGCPCAAEADFEDTMACTTTDPVTVNTVSCNIDAPIANPDGTMLVPALEIYEAGGAAPVATLFQCGAFEASFPANEGCDPVAYSYDVVSVIQTQDADGNLISSTTDDCVETFTVTILPQLTAGIIEDGTSTATCGALTVGLFDATGTLCPGSEITGMCPMTDGDDNGGTVTVVVDNPYPDCGEASFTITSGPCLGCDCGGIVTYDSPAPACSLGADDIPITISIADTDADGNPDCSVTPEIDNGDGTLTVVSFDIYTAAGGFLGSTFESSTFGASACVPIDVTFPANPTCEAQTYDFVVITAINTVDIASGTITDFVDDPLCAGPATFSVTINPTLSVQVETAVTDDGECDITTASLVAEDGTVCSSVTSDGACNTNSDVFTTTLTDPFSCVAPEDLTVEVPCSGCFEPEVTSDGCECFPNGIDLDNDGTNDLALVEITITDNPGQTGVDWTLDSSGGLFNPDGTPTTAMVMDNGDGTYTLTAYVAADNSTHTAVFTNTAGDAPLIFNSQPCLPCPPPLDEVPTVGEWGLIMLGLLMTITAVIGIRQRREEEIYA